MPRNLSSEQKQEFRTELVDQVQDQAPQCVLDPTRLCHAVSGLVGGLEYRYEKGRVDEAEALAIAKGRAKALGKFCVEGQEIDGTRTVCNYGTSTHIQKG